MRNKAKKNITQVDDCGAVASNIVITGKYAAGRDIIQHPITQESVNIPSIQSVLRKGETSEGEFFQERTCLGGF